jgi:hypothetical protein
MAWLLGLQPTTREKGKGKRLARLRGSSPPSKESNLLAPYYLRGPVFQKTSNGFFLEPSIPYTSEALKKENVKENLGARGCRSGSFRHSIIYSQ